MPTIFTKDALRASVEAATGGHVTVLYDDKGFPSYMRRIPKFNLTDLGPHYGSGVHPAFKVNGVEKSELLVAQYQSKIYEGRACSIPGVDPSVAINYDSAKAACENKGPGWHLLTNWEWAAIALWSLRNDFQPLGNTDYGRSHEASFEAGTRQDGIAPGSQNGNARIMTGSGPASFRHDGGMTGIADLVGNVIEWVGGLKLVDGRIHMPVDNNFEQPDAEWPGMSFFFDSTIAGAGSPVLSNSVINSTGEGVYASVAWKDMTKTPSLTLPYFLFAAALAPITLGEAGSYPQPNGDPKGYISIRNVGERFPYRGGSWESGVKGGLFSLRCSDTRGASGLTLGFRSAFVV